MRRKSHAPCEVGEKAAIASKPYLSLSEKDGVWDSSYVSTGVKDESGVEAVLGDPARVSALNANGNAYGYAIKGGIYLCEGRRYSHLYRERERRGAY